jgi:preprotein translocase subunit SecD
MLYFARWKLLLILGIIVAGLVYSAPNIVPVEARYEMRNGEPTDETRGIWGFLPHDSVKLGLDLRGGSHLVFEVDMDEVRENRVLGLSEEARVALRQEPAIITPRPAIVGDVVIIRVNNPEDLDLAYERLQQISRPIATNALSVQAGTGPRTSEIIRNRDDNTIRIEITQAALDDIRRRTVQQSVEVIRRRIDAGGTTEPTIAPQGDQRVLVQVPGESDPQRIIELVGTTASMSFHMVDPTVQVGADGQARTPPGVVIYPQDNPGEPFIAVQRRALVSGENLTNAVSTTNQSGQPAVSFTFDTTGAQAFGRATQQNVGQRFAIVLDDVVISAPVIRSPILGGSGIIEGNFTFESANDLSILLQAGALPARLTPVEQRTVGPGLGQDSIERGQIAIMVGFAAVIIFMLLAYGMFGVFSNIALLVNVVLILGALTGLGATLTLPGIAGIILTIGMAVDANVLIFERIREESRAGRSPVNAVETGYSKALSAILDANITTFIAAAVLYMLGAGPVRGFAVTLAIGIITSVFTAFVLSRLLVAMWIKGTKPKTLPI